jgi:hypothetical protein
VKPREDAVNFEGLNKTLRWFSLSIHSDNRADPESALFESIVIGHLKRLKRELRGGNPQFRSEDNCHGVLGPPHVM